MKACPRIIRLALCLLLYPFSTFVLAQNGTIHLTASANEGKLFFASLSRSDQHSLIISQPGRDITGTSTVPLAPPPYTIPLVFHIVSQNPSAITDQQIIDAVKDLNDAFAHSGVYAGGPGVNTGISFCLAKVDPNGGITNGITRTQSPLGDLDQDVESSDLKNLAIWDTKQYCNIWYVDNIKSEILSTYSCGNWSRVEDVNNASFGGDTDFKDGILTTVFGTTLVHKMGHYLGLLHTFVLGNCRNINCNTDGDGVCDTPPQSVTGGSCTSPQNSCPTDTISGFTVDVKDMNSNFMSLSGACTSAFTAGQTAKMINDLNTTHASLLAQNKCSPPCGENISASFTRNNWSPKAGDNISFTSSTSGGSNYEWSVNGTVVGGNTPNYSQVFPTAGTYKVTLKVYNANAACFASYTDNVIVGCGVLARFSPDKRIIASGPGYLDSVHFTNGSENALTYEWRISSDQGMPDQQVATTTDLTYTFPKAAHYTIRLIASNGAGCTDEAKFTLTVLDPTPDGFLNIVDIQCYQQTKVKVMLSACNNGYGYFKPNTPLTFYDSDPRVAGATKLGTFLIPDTIKGKCCGAPVPYILDLGTTGHNLIYAVLDDDGTNSPLVTDVHLKARQVETNYINNISFKENFQFKVTAFPADTTLEPGDTLQLSAVAGPGTVSSMVWSTDQFLNCSNCPSPRFIAGKKDITKKVVATNSNGCSDSAYSIIRIPPADDYIVTINSVDCAPNDSLHAGFTICNQFKRGTIPAGLKISFYDADPSAPGANLLGPAFVTSADGGKCETYSHIFKGIGGTGKIYAVVNDTGSVATPVTFPQDTNYKEKVYTNDMNNADYKPNTLSLSPADTLVLVNTSFPIISSSTLSNPSSISWDKGKTYSLSCYDCPSPVATIRGDALLTMKAYNQYGCFISGQANIKVIPPDMTIQILQAVCYNDSLMVKFIICMNNNYDSVFQGLPISFYGTDPSAGNRVLLGTYYTTTTVAGNCHEFSVPVKSPVTGQLFAVANDPGQSGSNPLEYLFQETDLNNNMADTTVSPFTLRLNPADTTVPRATQVQIIGEVTGGPATSITWEPIAYLSCTNCLSPVAAPTYPITYKLTVKNEFNCTASGTVSIKTFSNGIDVSIPNVFSPNADGHNDVFFILGSVRLKTVKAFSVFNRWGQKVFQASNFPANDPSFGWNGYYKGKPAETGAYVYIATIEFADGHRENFKGTVVLIR